MIIHYIYIYNALITESGVKNESQADVYLFCIKKLHMINNNMHSKWNEQKMMKNFTVEKSSQVKYNV